MSEGLISLFFFQGLWLATTCNSFRNSEYSISVWKRPSKLISSAAPVTPSIGLCPRWFGAARRAVTKVAPSRGMDRPGFCHPLSPLTVLWHVHHHLSCPAPMLYWQKQQPGISDSPDFKSFILVRHSSHFVFWKFQIRKSWKGKGHEVCCRIEIANYLSWAWGTGQFYALSKCLQHPYPNTGT